MIVGLLAAVAASAVTLLIVQARMRSHAKAGLVGRTIEVHTRDDQSMRGILHAEHADQLTFRETVYLQPGGDEIIKGVVHVPRDNVAWMREPQ